MPLSRESLRDQVRLSSNPARLRKPAFLVIDRAQDLQARGDANGGEVLVATAVALIAMCESANMPLQDVMTKATNIMAAVDGPFTSHLQAIRAYASTELLGKD